MEGPRALAAALDARAPLVWALVSAAIVEEKAPGALVDRCHTSGIPVQPVRASLLSRISPTVSGAGFLAACKLPDDADDEGALLARVASGVLLVPWCVQDPGNFGTLVRSAAAFGAAGCLAVGGADPWNPKAVRASAGTIHRFAVARRADADGAAECLTGAGYRLVAAVPRGGADPGAIDWAGRIALLLGAEVAGLPDPLVKAARPVSIPMRDGIDSLSVAAAGSILLERALSRP